VKRRVAEIKKTEEDGGKGRETVKKEEAEKEVRN
jgi:hypothetical protein